MTETTLIFVSWAPYCSRSDSIARRLGGESFMVYSPRWGSRYATIALKYASQTFRTLWLLARKRPRVVFVMAPPVVACLPVWLYCVFSGGRFVIDAHTGAFLDRRWKRMQWLQRFFSRRAVTTIVTNRYLQGIVEAWGARATIVTDVPVHFAEPEPVGVAGDHNMVFVSSFCPDEPTAAFLDAAAAVPEVQFHVTGDIKFLAPDLRENAPDNVHFTGFLSDGEFVGLIKACDAVLALTTQDHTMQRAAYEAIYLGKPVITSDFGLLREAFPMGTVHVKPAAEYIAAGIRRMVEERERLRHEAQQLREEKLRRWDRVADQLRELTGIDHPGSDKRACATRTTA